MSYNISKQMSFYSGKLGCYIVAHRVLADLFNRHLPHFCFEFNIVQLGS